MSVSGLLRKYAPEGVLIQPKIKLEGITYAVVRENTMIRFLNSGMKKQKGGNKRKKAAG